MLYLWTIKKSNEVFRSNLICRLSCLIDGEVTVQVYERKGSTDARRDTKGRVTTAGRTPVHISSSGSRLGFPQFLRANMHSKFQQCHTLEGLELGTSLSFLIYKSRNWLLKKIFYTPLDACLLQVCLFLTSVASVLSSK